MFRESLKKKHRGPRKGSPAGIQKPYVFFNNARMTNDALGFQALMEKT
jgi:hypothetical protein